MVMDYDRTQMPGSYDAGRSQPAAQLDAWVRRVAAPLDGAVVGRVLDLGCGTGRYAGPLAAHFDAEVLGLEPSAKMLAEAQAKDLGPRVRFIRGNAEDIPLADACVDLVFMSLVFHHLRDPDKAAGECRRVLRPGGHLAIRTPTAEEIPSYPYLSFFPSTPAILRQRMPPRAAVREACTGQGLTPVHHEVVPSQLASNWAEFVERQRHRADSILASIPDAEFQAGLAAMAEPGAVPAPDAPVQQAVDLFVFRAA